MTSFKLHTHTQNRQAPVNCMWSTMSIFHRSGIRGERPILALLSMNSDLFTETASTHMLGLLEQELYKSTGT